MAHQVLGNVAGGGDPANERAEARGMPTLGQAFDEFLAANPNRAPTTDKGYRDFVERYLGDWLGRPLDAIARRDVEARFNRITTQGGWATANRTISLLRSAYSRPCVDYDGLRNPVDLWLAQRRVSAYHHRSPLGPAHRPDPRDKKSRSTVNSPIFA